MCYNTKCNVHVLRYLNAVSEFTNHTWAKKMHDLLLDMKNTKEECTSKGEKDISSAEYEEFKSKYLKILSETEKERKIYLIMLTKKEEINLINRLNKYCDNHLLFLKKFFISFSNNRAKRNLRGIK